MLFQFQKLIDQISTILPPTLILQTNLPESQSAWIAVPVFAYAKKSDKDINTTAEEIKKLIESKIKGLKIEITNGFVNITPSDKIMAKILEESNDSKYGELDIGQNQRVVIDFSSPNVAKPMSIGHLRSTIIGDALQRIYRVASYQVISINHLGDWGTQFGKLLVAYQKEYGDLKPRSLSIQDLLDLYVKFHKESEADSRLEADAREMFCRLESGDEQIKKLWQYFVEISIKEFQKIYERLDVKIDETIGESSYVSQMPEIIDLAKQKGIAEESEGAIILRIPNEEAPLILKKQDDASIYATRDLTAIKNRVKKYQPKKILYVVGNEQSLHFRQLFSATKMLGLVDNQVELNHIKFGLIRTKEGRLSTRHGRVIYLTDVIDEAIVRSKQILNEREKSAENTESIAEAVGIAAVKYFDLAHDRKHDIVFDWDRMLNLKGDSAPYLMYSYTRARSILRKARIDANSGELRELLILETPEVEENLRQYIRTLTKFPLIIQKVIETNSPHHLAQYLNQLATEFHSFYEKYPVLKAEETEKITRLAYVSAVANVLKKGLNLLGIKVLEEM